MQSRRKFLGGTAAVAAGILTLKSQGTADAAPGDTSLHFSRAEDDALVAAAREHVLGNVPIITDPTVGLRLRKKNMAYSVDGGVQLHEHGMEFALCCMRVFDLKGTDLRLGQDAANEDRAQWLQGS